MAIARAMLKDAPIVPLDEATSSLDTEINFDEAMYMLMGREITEGHLPYTTMCDSKPVGLFALFGLLLALRGALWRETPHLGWFAAGGFALGVGIQIKQSVLFDMLAFLAGYFLLTAPSWRGLPRHALRALPALAVLAATTVVPTLLIIGTYILDGNHDAWIAGNITPHVTFYETGGIFWMNGLRAMAEQTPIWLGAIGAFAGAHWLVRDRFEARLMLFLAVWTVSVLVLQLFLGIGADHYWLHFLPVLGLLNGWLLSRGLPERLGGWRPGAALLSVLAAIGVFAVAQNPYTNAVLVGIGRHVKGEDWAGDTPRKIAADLAPRVRPGDEDLRDRLPAGGL